MVADPGIHEAVFSSVFVLVSKTNRSFGESDTGKETAGA